jgi:hypothetical protein
MLHVPAALDLEQFKSEVHANLPQPEDARIDFDLG